MSASVLGTAQVELLQRLAQQHQVHVPVHEAREHGLAAEVDGDGVAGGREGGGHVRVGRDEPTAAMMESRMTRVPRRRPAAAVGEGWCLALRRSGRFGR